MGAIGASGADDLPAARLGSGFHARLQDIENEAKSHSKQVDEGIEKLDQEADREAGGKDHGFIDKGDREAEEALGGAPDGASPDSTPPM